MSTIARSAIIPRRCLRTLVGNNRTNKQSANIRMIYNSSATPYPFTITVTDTTLYSPKWGAGTNSDTFWTFTNTTSAAVNISINVVDANGFAQSLPGLPNPGSMSIASQERRSRSILRRYRRNSALITNSINFERICSRDRRWTSWSNSGDSGHHHQRWRTHAHHREC
jgi:hypothetical protein